MRSEPESHARASARHGGGRTESLASRAARRACAAFADARSPELDPVAVSASTFAHQLVVARVAVALGERGHRVGGERELRGWERAEGRPVASAEVGLARDGTVALHRPDLVCWGGDAPIAIEVELTVKAPARLRLIVRGWARSRLVGGVVYYATPPAGRALDSALRCERAGARMAVLPLERAGTLPDFPIHEFHPKGCVSSRAATAPRTQGDPGWPPSTER